MGNVIPNVALSNKLPNVLTKTVTRNGLVIDTNQGLDGAWDMIINPADTVQDISGNGLDFITFNDPSICSSPLGAGLCFDGVNQFLKNFTASDFSTDGAIAMWFKPLDATTFTAIAAGTVDANNRWSLTINAGKLVFGYFNGASTSMTIALSENEFHHVVAGRASGVNFLYLDSVPGIVEASAFSGSSSAGLTVGANTGGATPSNLEVTNAFLPSGTITQAWVDQQYRDGLALYSPAVQYGPELITIRA
jgi:hypothetical protein